MRKFEFKKSYEEIEIVGEVYKVSLKDEDRKKYQEQLVKFYGILSKAEQADEKTIMYEESLKLEDEVKIVTLETLDVTLGEGTGEKLYEAAEQQTEELLDIVWGIADIINERRQEKLSKYTKKQVK